MARRGAIARLGVAAVFVAAAGACVHAGPLPPGFEQVQFDAGGERAATLTAYLLRPSPLPKPGPAIVALHGCGGLLRGNGELSARELDWAARWSADGYAVLFPDSFNSRGYREICRLIAAQRPIRPKHRADDAAAALTWLARQAFVDPARIALVGWSHGGSSALWTVDKGRAPAAADFKMAIAFYPGCRPLLGQADYGLRMPLTILIGSADDWTPPGPCRDLASRHGARLIEYPNAVHGFDAPNSPRRTRSDVGLSARGDGRVEIGTDPAARAAAIDEVRRILADAFR